MTELPVSSSIEESNGNAVLGLDLRKIGFRLLLGVIVLAGVAALLMSLRIKHNVCVVNGIYEPLIVQIDEFDPVTITPDSNMPVMIQLSSGNHVAKILSPESFRTKKEFTLPGAR